MFENQRSLSGDTYRQIASDLGLDREPFGACVDSRKFQDEVEEDFRQAGVLGVNATPTFFINGRILSGAQPFEAVQSIIDDELSE